MALDQPLCRTFLAFRSFKRASPKYPRGFPYGQLRVGKRAPAWPDAGGWLVAVTTLQLQPWQPWNVQAFFPIQMAQGVCVQHFCYEFIAAVPYSGLFGSFFSINHYTYRTFQGTVEIWVWKCTCVEALDHNVDVEPSQNQCTFNCNFNSLFLANLKLFNFQCISKSSLSLYHFNDSFPHIKSLLRACSLLSSRLAQMKRKLPLFSIYINIKSVYIFFFIIMVRLWTCLQFIALKLVFLHERTAPSAWLILRNCMSLCHYSKTITIRHLPFFL